ncbi:hypothetical protein A2803_04440 [Candidatus Woesebacteria bacterium RIFCSPHIGHO2_01_FULL_44_21]|uniref:Uncharacterized protein n=1 Tax=Candidatus Woesebacteria bacterium RIFCSPHIGHO2_01_FULL_44_21 TaxID=1802503 RepID=A0A1F7YXK4_9BACT|nr:MAG: hypothetical protein A2803_04440 [Candidatus Woesebacteria bacterium RIFCSPHIGHO2_01_FULL_44_21]
MTNRGTITPAILIITGAFLTVIYGLLILLSLQVDYAQRQLASEQALNIAEAGVNYYRWHLAHDPDDYQDGTGVPGPYTHEYTDPEGGVVGSYSLEVTPPQDGSSVVTIRSTGWDQGYPSVQRTIEAQYGLQSFARFAFLSNASTWYGSGLTLYGDVHSNNGIRHDGINYGRVMSARETYMCGTETGCFPPTEQPGVWGSGGDQNLWEFPMPAMDFDSVSFDFAQMQESAEADGLYLGPTNEPGYHLVFQNNGTVDVYEVTNVDSIFGYRVPGEGLGQEGIGGCRRRYQIIDDESYIGNYSLSDNKLIFLEDDTWVEGEVSGRVTVVAAGFPISSSTLNIWVRGSITYVNPPGQDALGLIAQNDVIFVRDVPNDFRIDAAMMAQKGQVLRYAYAGYSGQCSNQPGAVKNSLTINGAVISYNKSYWNYVSGGVLRSGFITRTLNYDGGLLFAPPPYFPTSGEYEFLNWREI